MKSGYSLTRLENFHGSHSTNGKGDKSYQVETSKMWKKLWSIKAPAKMKILLCRIAHDCLPTGVLLKGVGIFVLLICASFVVGRKL